MSSQFITTVQTIISRNLSPINAGVVTVGSIHGGTKHNNPKSYCSSDHREIL